jgi:hypothetical protein
MWMKFVPSTSVAGAFLVAQFTLILLLIPRFWQRGVAVSYWQQRMLVPVAVVEPVVPQPVPVPIATPIVPPIEPPAEPEGAQLREHQ